MAIKKIKAQSPDPYLGKIKGDTEFARLAHLNNVVDQINSNDPRPYKVYTALLSQSGINVPIPIVLENTLGGEIVWTRTTNGNYTGTLVGAFPQLKTSLFLTLNTYDGNYLTFFGGGWASNDTVKIVASEDFGNSTDYGATIEIRVYN